MNLKVDVASRIKEYLQVGRFIESSQGMCWINELEGWNAKPYFYPIVLLLGSIPVFE